MTPEQTERLLALPVLVVLDEAYTEFSGGSLAQRVSSQSNLVVLRTFSKWAGLAGLRIGYCVAPRVIADQVLRTKSPYNVNAAAIVAARASLDDAEYLRGNVRRILAERDRLFAALAGSKVLEPLPTTTNFILCRVRGQSARELRDKLARRGILIRAFGSPRLQDFVRISVGTPEQDNALSSALSEV
jgi:histidinol-phosphate aminotransferase